MIRLNITLEDARALARGANVIPLVGEVPGDLLTPVSAFLRLAEGRPYAFLLESVEGGERLGRYSFLGWDPWRVVRNKGSSAPLAEMREIMQGFRQPELPDLPPFTGGAVGNLAYDAVRALEKIPATARDDLDVPDLEAAFYDTIVAFDHIRQRIQIIANLMPGRDAGRSLEEEYQSARSRIVRVADTLAGPLPKSSGAPIPPPPGPPWTQAGKSGDPAQGRDAEHAGDPAASARPPTNPDTDGVVHDDRVVPGPLGAAARAAGRGGPEARGHEEPGPGQRAAGTRPGDVLVDTGTLSRDEFMARVRSAKEEIARGEIFQVVLSRRTARPFLGDPFSVYRALRAINPSPYNFYLRHERRALAGASPEMLVKVRDGRIETRPIAGTRPRGKDPEDDARLAAELRQDPKENAEHLMLVDLGRNDVGRVSAPGTVRVRSFANVERYSHVMHLVSSVEGTLREGCDGFDALLAAFPAGTVSGAPKIRALEIIEALEPTRRGPYAGAVFYRGFDGALDSAIAIRVVHFADGMAFVQAGAGIVADSDPAREFLETEEKSRASIAALARAEEDA